MNRPQQPAPPLPPGIDERTMLRALYYGYPDAVLVVDHAGLIVLANPAAAALFGYPDDALVGLSVDDLVPHAIRPRHAAYRDRYAEAPRLRPMGMHMDLVALRRDGSEVMVEIALSPLHAHGLPYVAASVRDIREYPRVQQALRRARYTEHLAHFGRLVVDSRDARMLLERAPRIAADALQVEVAMVYLLEPNRTAVRVASGIGNVAGEELGATIPYDPDSSPGLVVSKGHSLIVQDYRRETRFVAPRAYLDAGLVSAMAVPLTDRGRTIGAFSARSRMPERFGDEELGFLSSLADMLATAFQRASSEDALNHAQRLESVGQLTGGIAHDFNNLLTVIQGNLQVLEEAEDAPANGGAQRRRPLISAAMRAAKRGAELTSKLLAFSRRQMLQPTAVDVRQLLQSLAGMLRRTLDQRVHIEIDVPAAMPAALVDAGQLESALLNIAINARDAMPDGGLLRFEAGPAASIERVREVLDAAGSEASDFVAITVTDSGSGMSDAVKERVFEPFFTTKDAGRGTGLGMSTVYGFIKQSNGAIVIDSTPGQGTTVTLFLPRARRPATRDAAGLGDALPSGLRVLMVEDDPEVRVVVRAFLDVLGCRVSVATTGEEAVDALDSGTPFDVLLTDVALGPGMRGTALARRAQQRTPALAVLLMSGFPNEPMDGDGAGASAWDLLRKPFSREDLARALARSIEGRS